MGCISNWGQVFGGVPEVIEAMAEDGRPDGQEMLGALATPTHAWTGETGFELLSTAFDHATANKPGAFTHLEIVHAQRVVAEESRLACEEVVGLYACGFVEFKGNASGVA